MSSSAHKKTLILSGLTNHLYPLYTEITKKSREELLVIGSTGGVISQPYGCLIRNIILSVYHENVEAIYVIVDEGSKAVNKDELKLKILEAGISEETISIIDYISATKEDLLDWLAGPLDARSTIQKNMELIKGHPLMVKSLPVVGCIVSEKTGDYETITN
jgi:carbonic anhydrase